MMFSTIMNYHIYVYQTILLFAVFSLLGWIIETVYRSILNGRFINAGYLRGPFTPIYGFGGIIIMLVGILVRQSHVAVQLAYFALLTTMLELMIGAVIVKIFGYRLWDYRDNRFNFRGYICLKYSILWALLSWIFFYLVFPLSYIAVSGIGPFAVKIIAIAFCVYFIADSFFSTLAMADFFHKVESLYGQFSTTGIRELREKLESFQRHLRAFPGLNRVIERVIDREFISRFGRLIDSLARKRYAKRRRMEHEYRVIVKEIIEHDEYLRLKDFYHHNSSIYEHLQSVSYMSYRIAKALRLDYVSTVRGALLHDFFLYDWRAHDEPDLASNKYHGYAHPKIALSNARKHFRLNRIEEDIIVKHMWPITIIPPRYKESYVVTFVDKYLSSKEYTRRFRSTVKDVGGKVKARIKKRKKDVKKRASHR
jgi:uncharacterized membrane protein